MREKVEGTSVHDRSPMRWTDEIKTALYNLLDEYTKKVKRYELKAEWLIQSLYHNPDVTITTILTIGEPIRRSRWWDIMFIVIGTYVKNFRNNQKILGINHFQCVWNQIIRYIYLKTWGGENTCPQVQPQAKY